MTTEKYPFTAHILTPPSINGERMRWVFKHHGVGFRERRRTLAPMSLFPALRYAGRATGSKYVYVVGDRDNGSIVFRDPEKLVEYLDPRAEPVDRLRKPVAAANQDDFDRVMTVLDNNIRPWAYATLGSDPRILARVLTSGVPITQKIWIYAIRRLIAIALTWGSADEALTALQDAFETTDRILADGREFISGDRLTYADISLATNMAPAVMPPEYGGGGIFPLFDDLPDQISTPIARFRERTTGQYILNLFENHRLDGGRLQAGELSNP